jgi:cytochrome P450 family 6
MFLIFLSIIFFVLLFLRLRNHQNYFKNLKVPYVKSLPFVGVFKDSLLLKKGLYENIVDIYNHPDVKNEPFFGVFLFHKPAIFVKHPELIKRILVTDFSSFSDHFAHTNGSDPLGENLFHVNNPKWKLLRRKLSPFFSSGKLKTAYYLIEEIGTRFSKFIDQKIGTCEKIELELKKVTDLFSMDVVGSVVFGIDAHSLDGVFNEFQQATHSLFNFTPLRALTISSSFLLPPLMKVLNLKFFGELYTKFILRFVPEVMSERKKSGIKRSDLIDKLIELKNEDDEEFSMNVLCSQAAIFLSGGN